MRQSTTIRVSPSTRDALRALAEQDGLTQEEALARLLRAERQRRMGMALAGELSEEDEAWIDAGAEVVGDYAGR